MGHRTASTWRRDTELEVFLSSKGWIQTIANQRREEIQNRGETIKWWYSLEAGSYFLSKEICITMSFEFFYRTAAPNQVEDGNFRLNTRLLEHSSVASPLANQKKKNKKSHKPCSPHPKYCLLFLGTSDDHPVRSSVWPLSISSLRDANSFKLNCCSYKSES